MYLVSTVFKKTAKGWKWNCQVFHVSSSVSFVDDVTEQVAEKFWFEIKKHSIVIHSGSGTGFMVIEKALTESHTKEIIVKNVSVFNQ